MTPRGSLRSVLPVLLLCAPFAAQAGDALPASEKSLRAAFAQTRDESSCSALAQYLFKDAPLEQRRYEEALTISEGCADADAQNPRLHFLAVQAAWSWAYTDPTLSNEVKAAVVQRGQARVDRVLALVPGDPEALMYRSLLVDTTALLQPDDAGYRRVKAEAAQLKAKALAAARRKAERDASR